MPQISEHDRARWLAAMRRVYACLGVAVLVWSGRLGWMEKRQRGLQGDEK